MPRPPRVPSRAPHCEHCHRPALLVSALLVLFLSVPLAAQDLYLAGGRVLDPRSETVRTAGVLVVDGAIAGFPDAPPEGFGGEVVNAAGKWVLPGLRDLHTHSAVNAAPGGVMERMGTEEAAQRMLYAGITGFLDLFNLEDYVLGLRDRQRTGKGNPGADVFAAGPCLTATDGHCTQYRIPTRVIDTPDDARREIGELAAKEPDVVKLVYEHVAEELEGKTWRGTRPTLDVPTLSTAVAAASGHGIPTVVHVRSWRDVRDCVEAGATAVTHLPSHAPAPPELVARMAELGTVVIPTLAVADPVLVAEPERLDDPLLRAVAGAAILDAYREADPEDERRRRLIAGLKAAQEVRFESLRRLAAASVPLVAGTDAGNPFTVQGWSLHRELELMVEAGLTPWQALAAATVAPGDFLGRSWGTDVGDEGSLLVLDASPLDDVRNTKAIHAVVHHGRLVDREALLEPLPAPWPQRSAEEKNPEESAEAEQDAGR